MTVYEYRCRKGHEVTSRKFETYCPAYVNGKPCLADLERVGKGSRKKDSA